MSFKAVASVLRSRKTRVALVTVAGVIAARCGLAADTETVSAIVAVGVSLILAIAHEDSGAKRGKR